MRAASEWIFGLRRFLLVIGLAPLGCVVLLANLGMLPERGLAWGLACAWPLLMVALVLHYRTLMVLNDILVTALLLMLFILASPWIEASFARSSLSGDIGSIIGLAVIAFVGWMLLQAVSVAFITRNLAPHRGTRRVVCQGSGPVPAAVALDALRLVPGRSNAFAACGPLQGDGWLCMALHVFPYGHDADKAPTEATEQADAPAEAALPYRARIVEDGPDYQITAVETDDGACLTTCLLRVRPQRDGCAVTITETTDALSPTGAAMMWLKDFGCFSIGSKLDHLAGRPCRFGHWTRPRGMLMDLTRLFSRGDLHAEGR